MRELYPPIEPFASEFIDVGNGHQIYVERSGNPEGLPVVVLHGGPGQGGSRTKRQFFNPEKFQIIIFDQRGCGLSKYQDLMTANTTWDLVADIETIRTKYGFNSWHVYGSSWGSTLALAYAQSFPGSVASLRLGGIFLGSRQENSWIFESGADKLFPDKFQAIKDFVNAQNLELNLQNISKLVFSPDFDIALQMSKLCDDCEFTIQTLHETRLPRVVETMEDKLKLVNCQRIMFYYFDNNCFFEPDQLLNNIDKIRKIPTVIIQGRYDLVCPMVTAWKLHNAWPEAIFEVVHFAGHHTSDPALLDKILEYSDKLTLDKDF